MSKTIDTIIFDLGNVIIDIDEQRSYKALKDLMGITSFSSKDKEIIFAFERGEISVPDLMDYYIKNSPELITEDQIIHAWNAMLLDIPIERIAMMQRLRKTFNVFILSNTNAIHIKWVEAFLSNMGKDKKWKDLADRVYYSHEVGFRKPDERLYKLVNEDSGIVPEHTLFFDDKEENIVTAKSVGWLAYKVELQEEIREVIENMGLI